MFNCGGHGTCDYSTYTCVCTPPWGGPTCTSRACPSAAAWVSRGSGGHNDAHAVVSECSGVGACNTASGECACNAGFEGAACEVLACPRGCSGAGRCLSLRAAAAEGDAAVLPSLPHAASTYDAWDADAVHGCACDASRSGPECASRACPLGVDPLDPSSLAPSVAALVCTCPSGACALSGAIAVTYGGASAPVLAAAVVSAADEGIAALRGSGAAPGESLESVLRSLAGPGVFARVALAYGAPPGARVCGAGAVSEVTFATAMGAAGLGGLAAAPGSLTDASGVALPPPRVTISVTARSSATRAPCSSRGTCDAATGVCACFDGFFPSDGNGAPGAVGDCGALQPPWPVATPVPAPAGCPSDAAGAPCSGRGWCETAGGRFVCRCAHGWRGGACEQATCPFGAAWWAQPVEGAGAHPPMPCSNRGACDSATGVCACAPGYTGAACERLACPTGGSSSALPCSARGRCVSLRTLVATATGGGLPLGGGAPAAQSLACSLASGGFTLGARFAESAAVAWDATIGDLRVALANTGGVLGGATVEPFLGGVGAPATADAWRVCSGAPSAPAVTRFTFAGGDPDALPALTVTPVDTGAWDSGFAEATVLAPGGTMPTYTDWDADKVQGCACDTLPRWVAGNATSLAGDVASFHGPACALRTCPLGAAPMPPPAVPVAAVQRIACVAGGGSFTLSFRGATSGPIPAHAPRSVLRDALQAMPSIGLVSVVAEGLPSAAAPDVLCASGGAGTAAVVPAPTLVEFLTEQGPLPDLVADASYLVGGDATLPPSVTVHTLVPGTGRVVECSGRGTCDTATGVCTCFPRPPSPASGQGYSPRGDCSLVPLLSPL